MHEKIDISVVTFNSEKWVDLFMDSLLAQNYPLEYVNIFFSDNGSSDHTILLLNEFKEKLASKFASFNVFKRTNDGFGSGHNFNVNKGFSKYILVTNIDLEFEKDAIFNVVLYALSDDENIASWELRQKPYEHPKDYNPLTFEVSWSSSACILFSRKAFELIGGYEPKIFMYGEDVEISYRLRDRGYRLKYIPRAVCWHYAYEHKNQVKRLQFYGSLETNLCLRIRFGTFLDVVKGFVMYLGIFLLPIKFERHRRTLLKNLKKVLSASPYYFKTRKQSKIKFNFIFWDYEIIRDGSFYEFVSRKLYDEVKLVTVVVRTYSGRLELLKQAILSITNQTYQSIQIVIVEDGSKESEEYALELKEKYPLLKITYQSIAKAGRCVAGNTGLALAKGEYICFLDDDDLIYADHFEVLVHELNENSSSGAAYSSSFEVPTKIISKNPLKLIELEKHVFYRQKFSRDLLWNQNYIPIQSILFRRKLYDIYGGFDEGLDNLEDWNLWTRYSSSSDFLYVDKTTSLYRVPHENTEKTDRQKKLNAYYGLALEKQKDINVTISISEIRKISEEYAKSRSVKRRFVRRTANLMKSTKLTATFFNIIRKVYFKLKNK